MTFLQDAVKTLRNEIQELQTKHEAQFMAFASKFIEFEQGSLMSTFGILRLNIIRLNILRLNIILA